MVFQLLFLALSFFQVHFAQCDFSSTPVKRSVVKPLTTSVIIPCCGKHFYLLPGLLECYTRQTVLPDEIVVSLSDAVGNVYEESILLEQQTCPFRLKIIKSARKQSAGENRNIACANASGELLICQDADDIPHPQRVEIAKYWFENYKVDHLMHLWTADEEILDIVFDKTNLDVVRYVNFPLPLHIHIPNAHNGNICIRKKVAQKIKWEHVFGYDKDVEFNQAVYKAFNYKIAIKSPLIIYRNHLSSFL
jgi:glycosyltransferase involved in cell wall biosynthesis